MRKVMSFEKDPDNRWYAVIPDYPGHRAELEMVCGADTLLDILAQGDGTVKLSISDEETPEWAEMNLVQAGGSEGGGYYKFLNEFLGIKHAMDIWLCDVTLYVFGYLPPTIWFTKC